jgi:hypothetical protein
LNYIKLTNGFKGELAEGESPNPCLIPLGADPCFEAVSVDHSELGGLHGSHNVNAVVRYSQGETIFTFKVQETVEEIAELIRRCNGTVQPSVGRRPANL